MSRSGFTPVSKIGPLAAFILMTSLGARAIMAQGGPPMITDDTETVLKGHWEINTAFTIERGFDGRLFGTPLLDINYGTSEHTQLKVEIPWLVLHPNGQPRVQGPCNLNIGVRWRFRDEKEKHRIAMSMYPQIEFNISNSSIRRGLVDKGPEFLMPIQWQTQIGKFALGGDGGYRFKSGPHEIIYGVILGPELNGGGVGTGAVPSTGPAPK